VTEHKLSFQPEDWLSAAETIQLVRQATGSEYSHIMIAKRAHAGLVRTWAQLVVADSRPSHDVEIPPDFWWAEGQAALTQNWAIGDFETWIDQKFLVQAFGVKFHRDGLQKMLPDSMKAVTPEPKPPASPNTSVRNGSGGRPRSEYWTDWVAELACLIHEEGLPTGVGSQGADALIARVADRLAQRGLEGPARSTVQPTAIAILRRLRDAENSEN
jgi:hypothetical protein